MNKIAFLIFVFAICGVSVAQTIEQCQLAAENNYPLIRKYDLIELTTSLSLDNIQKGWLPQVAASAQATYQSDVASWPDEMKQMLGQMGVKPKGLAKDQYRIGVDVNQTIYDGGSIKSQKEIARLQGEMLTDENKINLYSVRKRVNELFFAILLTDSRIELTRDLRDLLASNEHKLAAMFKEGTAAESDFNSMKAERIGAEQQLNDLAMQRDALRKMLKMLCGIEITNLERPQRITPSDDNLRPEMHLFETRLRLADAQERQLDTSMRPRLSVFASTFYGYPGYNMFEDMMNRNFSLNGMIGTRLTWNIGALYTRKGDKAKIKRQREMIANDRDVFLFNNNIEKQRQRDNIARYEKLIESDNEMIMLRQSVRKAAESKLRHGIIDVNDLVKEINNENGARLRLTMHQTELLKEMYDFKFTVNGN